MVTHLRAHNIWSFIEPELAQVTDDTARKKVQLTPLQIHQGVGYSIVKTAKEVRYFESVKI